MFWFKHDIWLNTTATHFLVWAQSSHAWLLCLSTQEVCPTSSFQVDTRPGWWTVPEHSRSVWSGPLVWKQPRTKSSFQNRDYVNAATAFLICYVHPYNVTFKSAEKKLNWQIEGRRLDSLARYSNRNSTLQHTNTKLQKLPIRRSSCGYFRRRAVRETFTG